MATEETTLDRDRQSPMTDSQQRALRAMIVFVFLYLDLSYGIPLLGYGEMLSFTRQALGVAPTSKLMYSSDGIGVPELHWISAMDGRRVIGEALGELVSRGELDLAAAEAAGEDVLRANATRLYGL